MLSRTTRALGKGIFLACALLISTPSLAADPKKADSKAADSKSADAKKAADAKAAEEAKAAAEAKAAEEKKAAETGGPAEKAKYLYSTGVDLSSRGDFAGAEAKFKEAWALQKSYDVAANLGFVEVELGRPAEAALYLTYAVNNFPASGQLAKLGAIQSKQKEVLAKVARLSLSVNVAGAEVRINGKVIGKAPIEGEQYLPEGACKIEVTAPGYDPSVDSMVLKAGSERKLKIELHPPTKSAAPAWILGGTGIGLAVGGLASMIAWRVKYAEAERLHGDIVKDNGTCGGASPHAKCADLKSSAELADTLYATGLGLGLGGAALGVGGILYLAVALDGFNSRPPATTEKPASGPRITRVGTQGTGVFLQGTF